MKSPMGGMLARAAILSVDSKGKRIPPIPAGFEGIKCKETRAHALSNPTAEETREEEMERAGRLARAQTDLSDLERGVLRLQGKLQQRVEERIRIPAGDLVHYLRDDYTLVPGSEEVVKRLGLPPVSTVEVVGYEVIQVEQLDYEDMAERLCVTVRQVRRAVVSAHKKLRRAR